MIEGGGMQSIENKGKTVAKLKKLSLSPKWKNGQLFLMPPVKASPLLEKTWGGGAALL